METVEKPNRIGRRLRTSATNRRSTNALHAVVSVAALAAITMISQGCFNSAPPIYGGPYGGPAEYAASGYPADPFAFEPYGLNWYPEEYYYYFPAHGDGDHDCDDGFCGQGRGRNHQPHVPKGLIAKPGLVLARPTERTPMRVTAAAPMQVFRAGGFHASTRR